MRQGFFGYVDDLSDALKNMTVTLANGEAVSPDRGVECFIEKAEQIRKKRGIFFFAGNGASASMAEHMSHDWFQNADTRTLTSSEVSHITAISNDLSFEDVFAYKIGKMLSGNDALITISSSGNSPNIIKAINTARGKGMFIVTVSGMKPDNKSRSLGDINFYVPATTYGMAESAHSALLHCMLDLFLDKYIGGRH